MVISLNYKTFKITLTTLLALSLSACVSMIDPNGLPVSPIGDVAAKTVHPIVDELETRLTDCRQSGIKDKVSTNFACVSLLYGTNRSPKKSSDNFYGKAPLPLGSETILGEVVVSIPSNHQVGKDIKGANRPVNNNEIKYRKKVYAIWGGKKGPRELTEDQFETFVKHKINSLSDVDNTALVFIHGFNVSFENAAYNTAQLKTDLDVKGPAFFFSWPSNGNPKQYLSDQQDADLSAENLAKFLRLVKRSVGEDTSLNIIAHSMGHRVVGQAFNIIRSEDSLAEPLFETGIFASADLDEDLFERWIVGKVNTPLIVKQPILYVTDDDKALGLSRKILFPKCDDSDQKYRVGLVTKKDCETGKRRVSVFSTPYETIDLSNEPGEKLLKIFNKNHNKYTKSPKVICHISRLFDGGKLAQLGQNDIIKRIQNDKMNYWITDPKRRLNWKTDCSKDGFNNLNDPFLVSYLNVQK